MAVRVRESDLLRKRSDTTGGEDLDIDLHTHNQISSLQYDITSDVFPSSVVSSLPTVSEIHHPMQMHPHPLTGQVESRVTRRNRLTDLMAYLKSSDGLNDATRKHLADADLCIHRGKNNEAIPSLEAALLSVGDAPRLQCVLWRLLGNAHLSLGHYQRASTCHMHQLAFCRELDDFSGLTMAECNLGIAYMKLGLFKLAGRCFVQYLDNSRVLQDEMGTAYACSNLGVLAKTMALQEYQKMEGDDRNTKSKNNTGMKKFKEHLDKAISYFEQHLEIVERHSDLEKQARAYANLASCYEMLHQYIQAIFCHKKRLEAVCSTGDRIPEICTLCHLGNCLRATGKLQEALEQYSLGLELCQATDYRAGERVILLNLGTTCQLLGQAQKAIEWYTLYLIMAIEINDLSGQARACGILAELYQLTGKAIQAHEYYKKLVDLFQELGDKKSQFIAKRYMLKAKEIMEKQQKRQTTKISKKGPKVKSRKIHKGSKKEYLWSASIGGSLNELHIADSPMIRHGKKTKRNKTGTWSPGLKRWYAVHLDKPETSTCSMPSSTTMLKNRQANSDVLQVSSHRPNIYRTKGVMERLNSQEGDQFLDTMMTVRSSFYTLGDFMEPVHHRLSSEEGSVTEYEEVLQEEESFSERSHMPEVFSSKRHLKDLKDIGKSLLDPSRSSEHEMIRVEEEWDQWLDLQHVDKHDKDAELPENLPKQKPKKNNKPSRSKKLKKGDDLFTPAPRPPPPLPPPVAVKPVKPKTPRITKTKRSFRGLSIFSDTNQSQENLLKDKRPNRSLSLEKPPDVPTSPRPRGLTAGCIILENHPIITPTTEFRESRII